MRVSRTGMLLLLLVIVTGCTGKKAERPQIATYDPPYKESVPSPRSQHPNAEILQPGSLLEVYARTLAEGIRSNWAYTGNERRACVVTVEIDAAGHLQNALIKQSSGDSKFDNSVLNAVARTAKVRTFVPPTPEITTLQLTFTTKTWQ